MDLFAQMKMADFFLKLYRGELNRLCGYEFTPQKVRTIPDESREGQLPRATPEQQGISSAHIQLFLKELSRRKDVNPHSVLVMRHGKVITQAHFRPYRGDYPHMLYSLSKTFTATAVGMAIGEGKLSLSDRLVDLFPDKVLPLHHPRLNAVTVRDLLTMQAGLKFNELGSVMGRDWEKGFLQSEFLHEPGAKFSYNSINSYMLSAAVKRRTGQGLVEYLTPRLFEPLGIRNVYWEKCPMGLEKGGWGLSLRIEDAAKLGLLYLQRGTWMVDGVPRQLLPQQWVAEATRNQLTDLEGAENGYGYHVWIGEDGNSYHFNGMFGQYVVVFPRYDVVVALFAGSQNLMPQGGGLELIHRFFGSEDFYSDVPLPKNVRALRGLVRTMKGLTFQKRETMPRVSYTPKGMCRLLSRRLFPEQNPHERLTEAQRRYDGAEYVLQKSFGSLLPLVLQGVHGNFTGGMEKIRIQNASGCCTLTVWEGGQENVVRMGTDGAPRYSEIDCNGETYMVGSMARWTTDEDDRDVLKAYLSFIETPDTRILKLIFEEDRVLIRFEELPSVRDAFEKIGAPPVPQTGGGERVRRKLKQLLQPKTTGERVDFITH